MAEHWQQDLNLDYNSRIQFIGSLHLSLLLREDYCMSVFWRIVDILAIMFVGHFLIGNMETWLKKKKLFGYKDK
jgi:hypothetical protein